MKLLGIIVLSIIVLGLLGCIAYGAWAGTRYHDYGIHGELTSNNSTETIAFVTKLENFADANSAILQQKHVLLTGNGTDVTYTIWFEEYPDNPQGFDIRQSSEEWTQIMIGVPVGFLAFFAIISTAFIGKLGIRL